MTSELIVNTYRLVTGKHTRWGADGTQSTHSSNTPTAIMHNLTYAEVVEHRARIELVSGTPPLNPAVSTVRAKTAHGDVLDPDLNLDLDPEDEDIDPTATANYVELLDGVTASEAINLIETVTDIKELRSIRACERKGKERVTVLKAIDAQIVKAYADQKKGGHK